MLPFKERVGSLLCQASQLGRRVCRSIDFLNVANSRNASACFLSSSDAIAGAVCTLDTTVTLTPKR